MQSFSPKQITEINAVIAEIEKSIKAKCEIGAHDKVSMSALLKGTGEKKKAQFFNCRREYSDAIVSFFVKEKGVVKNRFNKSGQSSIFILK